MRFAPQRRALFRHHNFQKWSENGVLCSFWLRHVLRATTACNFSSLIWPDVSAPAALASLLFNLPGPQIIGKNAVNRDFSTFSRSCIFFLLTLSLLFSSLTLPTSVFPSVHIVGSLTSKLPSKNVHSRSRDRDIIKKHMAISLINPLFSGTTPIFNRFSVFIHFPPYLLMIMMMMMTIINNNVHFL